MTNIERVAEHIDRCQHREEVLSLLLKPRIQHADPVNQKIGVSVADVLSRADITALNK